MNTLSPLGFQRPTTTPVPDEVFDVWLTRLSGNELKVLLYIVRRTLGFRKDCDAISFNQFARGIKTKDGRQLDSGCGVGNRTRISEALKALVSYGLVTASKSQDERGENETTVYTLRFVDNSTREVVPNGHDGGTTLSSKVVPNGHPQQTAVQHTVKQHSEQPSYERFVET